MQVPQRFVQNMLLIWPACLSIIVAVTVAMIGIGITKPDAGNVLSVGENVSLVKGLGAVMNIVLAFCKCPVHITDQTTDGCSRPCRISGFPGRAQESSRLQQSFIRGTRIRSHLLHGHFHHHLLLCRTACDIARLRIGQSHRHQSCFRSCASDDHHSRRGEWIRCLQEPLSSSVEEYGRSASKKLEESGQLVGDLCRLLAPELVSG